MAEARGAIRARVRVRYDWDDAVTYDVLVDGSASEREPVFIRREELLRPLESAILDAKRGTILDSGYRGSGKTTRVIEALRTAKMKFDASEGPRLLPIVLNVSAVSTSLSSPEAGNKLQIDPRRLLVALLRAFLQNEQRLGDRVALRSKINSLHQNATASALKLAQNSGTDSKFEAETQIGLKLDSAELLKASSFPAGLISLGLASLGASNGAVDAIV
jgi:hypothetical protein